MRVFVAGASGAIGTRLVPQLIDRGHEVIGTFRSPSSAERVRALGAEPIALDLLDARAVRKAVLEAQPDAIVHQATALADVRFSGNLDRTFAQTNRLRTEGTDALLTAAREAGVRRFVAQSYASTRYAREGGPVKTEDDPLDPTPVAGTRETNAAMRYLDQAVTDAGGIALRYGGFYGAPNDGLIEPVRKRQFPIVGEGGGVSSFIHLDDAAAATVLALEHDRAGIYNIVDDEPAAVRDWLPVLANALGAKPPRHFPRWLARLFAGEAAVMMGTESRGASNAKAKRELGWTLRYPSWREGFVAAYASTNPVEGRNSHPATRTSHSPTLSAFRCFAASEALERVRGGHGREKAQTGRRHPRNGRTARGREALREGSRQGQRRGRHAARRHRPALRRARAARNRVVGSQTAICVVASAFGAAREYSSAGSSIGARRTDLRSRT
jgi:nucleoside-diphosphate-sugar epimerase